MYISLRVFKKPEFYIHSKPRYPVFFLKTSVVWHMDHRWEHNVLNGQLIKLEDSGCILWDPLTDVRR